APALASPPATRPAASARPGMGAPAASQAHTPTGVHRGAGPAREPMGAPRSGPSCSRTTPDACGPPRHEPEHDAREVGREVGRARAAAEGREEVLRELRRPPQRCREEGHHDGAAGERPEPQPGGDGEQRDVHPGRHEREPVGDAVREQEPHHDDGRPQRGERRGRREAPPRPSGGNARYGPPGYGPPGYGPPGYGPPGYGPPDTTPHRGEG